MGWIIKKMGPAREEFPNLRPKFPREDSNYAVS